ncbi:unnamed protein product [Mycena citricolor]|uniref:Uncharacterized protein n=1 Tax=Mycena citricolor TaxID=2018698 RepID=A0AAD2HXW5_9AGAR|nr:unnamed protein product [Mycena citricolor]CAK5282592.1 unnamed protein product [Mycena citricolor]CAK5282603.1 unnamed protein product [Mycena citricolor]
MGGLVLDALPLMSAPPQSVGVISFHQVAPGLNLSQEELSQRVMGVADAVKNLPVFKKCFTEFEMVFPNDELAGMADTLGLPGRKTSVMVLALSPTADHFVELLTDPVLRESFAKGEKEFGFMSNSFFSIADVVRTGAAPATVPIEGEKKAAVGFLRLHPSTSPHDHSAEIINNFGKLSDGSGQGRFAAGVSTWIPHHVAAPQIRALGLRTLEDENVVISVAEVKVNFSVLHRKTEALILIPQDDSVFTEAMHTIHELIGSAEESDGAGGKIQDGSYYSAVRMVSKIVK